MKEDENQDSKNIKQYLMEQNKEMINGMSDMVISPIKNIAGSIVGFLKPQAFVKNFGMITGTPALMMIGDKIEEMADGLKTQIIEQRRAKKDDFLLEAQKEKEISLQEEHNDLLKEIASKDFAGDPGVEEKKAGIFKTILGNILGGIGLGAGAGVGLKSLTSIKGLKKIGMIAIKGLGKIALPLALLMGAFDFTKGFKDALAITGREDLGAKIQAGLSAAISGLTLGLLDAKSISKNIETFKAGVIKIFTDPFEVIKSIGNKVLGGIDWINNILATITFDLIPKGVFKKGILFVKEKIANMLITPFTEIKNWIVEKKPFDLNTDLILNQYDKVMSEITHGIDRIKDFFINIKNLFVERIINPLIAVKNAISEGNIFETLSNYFDTFNLMEFLAIDEILEDIRKFKEGILNIIKSPKEFITSFFNKPEIEDNEYNAEQKYQKTKRIDVKEKKYKKEEINVVDRGTSLFKPTDRIKREKINQIKEKETKLIQTTNNQSIINSNTNNNIISEDMSIQTDDTDLKNLRINLAY